MYDFDIKYDMTFLADFYCIINILIKHIEKLNNERDMPVVRMSMLVSLVALLVS